MALNMDMGFRRIIPELIRENGPTTCIKAKELSRRQMEISLLEPLQKERQMEMELITLTVEIPRVLYISESGKMENSLAKALSIIPMATSMRVVLSIPRGKETVNKLGVKAQVREIAMKVNS